MKKGSVIFPVSKKGIVYFRLDQCCRQGEVTGADSFGQAEKVGVDVFLLAGVKRAQSSKTNKDLIQNQVYVVVSAELFDRF